jgi:hypothetical protein
MYELEADLHWTVLCGARHDRSVHVAAQKGEPFTACSPYVHFAM